MRVHAIVSGSLANGPGSSFVIWTQGCARRCDGCSNPGTWDPAGGTEVRTSDLLERILVEDVDSVVFSGGEPLDQAGEVDMLAFQIHESRPELRLVLFTGHPVGALKAAYPFVEKLFDLVIAGPYDHTCPRSEIDPPLVASRNQELWFPTGRLSVNDLVEIPDVEYLLDDDDNLVRTGIGAADLDGM